MALASDIYNYYLEHLNDLPEDKQFHFASRLSSWSHDKQAIAKLIQLKPRFATETIRSDLSALITNPPAAKINASERRAPYFKKYPELRGYMLALFRVRHLLFHYDIDARSILRDLISTSELYALSETLQNDQDAVAVLSTYAINYIYLVEVILFPRHDSTLDSFLDSTFQIAAAYDDTAEDSLLLVYLFTHCVIGASNFYQTPVSAPAYTRMLDMIEQRIALNFTSINLDNKFEFLVCCKLVGFSSHLAEKIQQEAAQSISPEGIFLIDTINSAGQNNKTSFTDSEHRNVLYIMSQQPFIQQTTTV